MTQGYLHTKYASDIHLGMCIVGKGLEGVVDCAAGSGTQCADRRGGARGAGWRSRTKISEVGEAARDHS